LGGVPFKVIVPVMSPAVASCSTAATPVIVNIADLLFISFLMHEKMARKRTTHPI
jgi:hypothetical protein